MLSNFACSQLLLNFSDKNRLTQYHNYKGTRAENLIEWWISRSILDPLFYQDYN